MEYRGYDSAGIATIWEGELNCIRAKGKLHKLRSKIEKSENPSPIGIGHTRWATHGKPDEHNAHPHMDMIKRIAVVQNGIIENYRELREQLKAQGNEFISETDTEVVPHLIAQFFKEENNLFYFPELRQSRVSSPWTQPKEPVILPFLPPSPRPRLL